MAEKAKSHGDSWRSLSPVALFNIGGYMLCSASLLIVNKVAVHHVPSPSFILLLQMLGTAIAVKCSHLFGVIAECDALSAAKVTAFMPVALIFTATVALNMYSLKYANVETFMVFRFSTPLAISLADFYFMGRALPDQRSWFALFALLGGGVGYTMADSFFDVRGYFFCCLWYVVFCLDQIYLKHVVDNVKMDSMWGRVYYSNLLSCIPLTILLVCTEMPTDVLKSIDMGDALVLGVSVAMGAAMSYFAWSARASVTATTFTVVGNVCKLLTMTINVAIWDKHADALGIGFLAFSFFGASLYRQSPLRPVTPTRPDKPEAKDIEECRIGSEAQCEASQPQSTEMRALGSDQDDSRRKMAQS